MKFKDNTYIQTEGVFYPQILKSVKKSSEPLKPIFEAFTNSLEAIDLVPEKQETGIITINHYLKKGLFDFADDKVLEFDKLIIEDTGKGFDNEEFERFLTYADTRKGYNNRGSGRLQLIHFFENCKFTSIYKENNSFKQRNFNISKSNKYVVTNNTITFLKETKDLIDYKGNTKTILTLENLLVKTDRQYYTFSINDLKDKLVNHYIQYFCLHKERLPKIIIKQYINNEFKNEIDISLNDIPDIDKKFSFSINYNKVSLDANNIEKSEKTEVFDINSFKIDKNKLSENIIKLTSKNEIVELDNQKINITCISNKDDIDNSRFLFLISSQFLNERDSDIRGDLKIPTKETFKNDINLFQPEEIFLEDIEINANNSIINEYPIIQDKNEQKKKEIKKLKSMFLLNDEFLNTISISLNDTQERILEKVYIAESRVVAKIDSNIKNQIEKLDALDPSSENYENDFNGHIDKLTKEIPLQNRKALTHYVARRRLVLELLDKILNKNLQIQKNDSRDKDEALIHNLIFKQRSNNPDTSDLWLINEDFILFKGSSELRLKDLTINAEKIFKEDSDLTPDELEYKNSLEEKKYNKRPDVLLFPDEGKCIIIEFKAPNVNISKHLTQIQNYATLIRNYTKNEFQFDTFYGYLLGEKISALEVDAHDPDFKQAYNFDYLFRPVKTVSGKISNRTDGSIYMEIIKYSTLLERAKNRNEVFINKLTKKNNIEIDEDCPF